MTKEISPKYHINSLRFGDNNVHELVFLWNQAMVCHLIRTKPLVKTNWLSIGTLETKISKIWIKVKNKMHLKILPTKHRPFRSGLNVPLIDSKYNGIHVKCYTVTSVKPYINEWVSDFKFNGLSQMANIKVHVIHISCVILRLVQGLQTRLNPIWNAWNLLA